MSRQGQFENSHAFEPATQSSRTPAKELPQILYLVRREGLSSVFMSQVVKRLAAIAEAGVPVALAVLMPPGFWLRRHLRHRWRKVVNALPRSLAGRVWRLPSFPSRIEWPWGEACFLRWWLRARFRSRGESVILQCRNATMSNMALLARPDLSHVPVIFDCRGLLDYELLYRHGMDCESPQPKLQRDALRLSERQQKAAHQSDGVFCVSNAMAQFLVEEYGIPRSKCVVVPCCVDTSRFEDAGRYREDVRRELGLQNRFIVAYCGSLARYQLPHQSLQLFQRIRALQPNAHFLGLTTEPEKLRSAGREVGLHEGELTVLSLPHSEVPRYLSSADCGLLLREASPVNHVAAPVKFGEYLASGTPVIMSQGIGDYSELARRENTGVVLPTDVHQRHNKTSLKGFLADYNSDPKRWRARCRQIAQEYLDFEVHLPNVLSLYERLV